MQSSEIFAAAFNGTSVGLLLVEKASGVVIEANAAFLRMCGLSREDFVGDIFLENPPIGAAIELPLEMVDGRRLLLSVAGTEMPGGIVQLEISDVSTRESARLAERLDAQRQLAQRMTSEFHDMHRALEAAGEMLAACARQGQSTFLEADQIRKSADRAGGILRELAAYSEQTVLQVGPVQLNELIESMHPVLEQLLGTGIRISLDLDPRALPVVADPEQVRQILIKLAANAREALNPGGTFRIETRNAAFDDPTLEGAEGRESYTVMAVSDDGPGLDDESWAHLYEPFFTTKGHGKRGLGLAAVHGIVRQSGGRMWTDSEPGRGTSFRIYLPQGVAKAAAKDDLTILVVEENEGIRSVVMNILKKHGYQVEAVEKPGEVVAAQNVRTLVLNGHNRTEPGATTLSKPFDLDALLETVRGLVGR